MENMAIYEAVRKAPSNALRAIQAGRLKGKTDINPMWRIKALTEQFGPVGFGWKYEIVKEWQEPGANGEVAAFVDINLYVKWNGEWSEPIPGNGGSMFISKEKNGLYTDDEAYKKALTDAISVSCKALGFAADVYWEADITKYIPREYAPTKVKHICADCGKEVTAITGKSGNTITPEQLAGMAMKNYGQVLCAECQAKRKAGN